MPTYKNYKDFREFLGLQADDELKALSAVRFTGLPDGAGTDKILTLDGSGNVRKVLPSALTGASNVTDTDTIDMSGDGTPGNPLFADAIVSNNSSNAIVNLDGLYAPATIRNGIVYGGIVTWMTGYTYNVSEAGYYINGVFYISPSTIVTLDPPALDFNRVDVFVVDNTSSVDVLVGTPASTPAEPTVNAATQLRLSFALVEVGTTQPTLDLEVVYRENTEWATSTSGSSLNPNSTNAPCTGLKAVEGVSVTNNQYVLFSRTGSINPLSLYNVLKFNLKSTINWGAGRGIYVQFESSGVIVGQPVFITNGSYGFQANNINNCQVISIPLTDFALTVGSSINAIRIKAAMPDGNINFYLDDMTLQDTTINVGTAIIFQNGLTYNYATSLAEWGGTLLHNTTVSSEYFKTIFTGFPVYDFTVTVEQLQSWQNGCNVLKLYGAGRKTADNQNNTVSLGVHFSGYDYPTVGDPLPGYLGFGKPGYILGTNMRHNGSFGMFVSDDTAKVSGMFIYTNGAHTDAFTFFSREPAEGIGAVGNIAGNDTFEVDRIMTLHVNKRVQLFSTPDYADNAAAIAGGLEVGMIYRTGDVLKIVH